MVWFSSVPSVTFESVIDATVTVSSSIIVPVPVSVLPGILAVIVNCSSFSSSVSGVLGTVTVVPVDLLE